MVAERVGRARRAGGGLRRGGVAASAEAEQAGVGAACGHEVFGEERVPVGEERAEALGVGFGHADVRVVSRGNALLAAQAGAVSLFCYAYAAYYFGEACVGDGGLVAAVGHVGAGRRGEERAQCELRPPLTGVARSVVLVAREVEQQGRFLGV